MTLYLVQNEVEEIFGKKILKLFFTPHVLSQCEHPMELFWMKKR